MKLELTKPESCEVFEDENWVLAYSEATGGNSCGNGCGLDW